ncbi:metalloregulator ArsR/SmtB family transcription factor [Actinomycetospora cinnamomea]|uniref:Nucleotide-binding universal stress UspA family protein n=1 Tax=Actinomycetospora cinnamomea TaxID=663609 RepID=A0A2U1FCN5_9PSEU|nr:metalloregulator ArsR/SmtB family transcription factor [Actinomycetospora cinnamomea]PVZ09963.1 nucleotide-binding universal stress UspA family protein [Actinomycetospora cinnamomea]
MDDSRGVLQALASPTRREILWMLGDEERAAGEIAAALRVTAPTVSEHLRVWREAGLVAMGGDGSFRRYRARRPVLGAVQELLGQGTERWTPADDVPERERASARTGHVASASVELACSRGRVFEAFTDAQLYSRWLGAPVSVVDGHVSATLEWGTQVRGRYEHVVEPELIVMWWDFADDQVPVPGGEQRAYAHFSDAVDGGGARRGPPAGGHPGAGHVHAPRVAAGPGPTRRGRPAPRRRRGGGRTALPPAQAPWDAPDRLNPAGGRAGWSGAVGPGGGVPLVPPPATVARRGWAASGGRRREEDPQMSTEHDAETGAGTVVVGVDGSAGARVALDRALREGARLGTDVTAVAAFSPSDQWAIELGSAPPDLEAVGERVRAGVQRTVDDAVAAAKGEGVDVPEVRVVADAGAPADVLCRVARDAELLVVGHRGRGALATRLIGSVGLGVVVHARCPVLVVRAPETADA